MSLSSVALRRADVSAREKCRQALLASAKVHGIDRG
jgi:hypothetical protein